jgi:hypothetical protein
MITKTPEADRIDKNDHRILRHSRDRFAAFPVGQYINPPPMLFTRDGHNVWEADNYRGKSAFLILGGPSFGKLIETSIDINGKQVKVPDALKHPGFITMSTNNAPRTFRTDLWTLVDNPVRFIKSIWLDPRIRKYVPMYHAEKKIFDNEKWVMTDTLVGDCPNVCFYRRNEHFQASQFLTENTFNWGNHTEIGGGRSVMLVAVRLLYYLGIRKIFLLGCDFKMDANNKYHFDQDRTTGSQKGNNESYEKLDKWFKELKPEFEKNGLEVYNCNDQSGLRAFPFINFDEAFRLATFGFPMNLESERTAGLYERESLDKKKKKKKDNKK